MPPRCDYYVDDFARAEQAPQAVFFCFFCFFRLCFFGSVVLVSGVVLVLVLGGGGGGGGGAGSGSAWRGRA